MLRQKWTIRTLTFLLGFFPVLAALSFAEAQELKPVLTIKLAGPEALMNVAEKIAQLSDSTQAFEEAVAPFKDLAGLNRKGSIGLVLRSDGKEIRDPVLILPIENLDEVSIPNFEMLTLSLKKQSEGVYHFDSPFGVFVFEQKKGYLLATSLASKSTLPDDPTTLLAGMEDYTAAVKVDFENTTLESIQAFMMLPQMLVGMYEEPSLALGMKELINSLETGHKELRSVTFGVTLDPKTAQVDFSAVMIPRKDSEMAKQLDFAKTAKTMFSGFQGGKNAVLTYNAVEYLSGETLETTFDGIDTLIDGALEQIEIQSETEEEFVFAESVAETARAAFKAILREGKFDYALSLDHEGTLLGAVTAGDTIELENLGNKIIEQMKIIHGETAVDDFLKKYGKKELATVEGFKVSSLVFPIAEAAATAHPLPPVLMEQTLCLYRAVKEGEALAFAVGFDEAKTEKAFRDALAATKTEVALKQPIGSFSFSALGGLLKKFHVDKLDDPAPKFVNMLAKADSDATITVHVEAVPDGLKTRLRVSGAAVSSLAEIIKLAMEYMPQGENGILDRSGIRNF